MEAEIDETGGHLLDVGPLRRVREGNRNPMPSGETGHGIGHETLVAEFEGVANAMMARRRVARVRDSRVVTLGQRNGRCRVLRKQAEEVVYPVRIESHRRRHLPEDGTELCAELENAGCEEIGEGDLHITQLLVVGDESAAFHRIPKTSRDAVMPLPPRRCRDQPVEAAIDLQSVEPVCRIPELVFLSDILRIEPPTPVFVGPPRSPHPQLGHVPPFHLLHEPYPLSNRGKRPDAAITIADSPVRVWRGR